MRKNKKCGEMGNEFTQELYPWILDSRGFAAVWVSIENVNVD